MASLLLAYLRLLPRLGRRISREIQFPGLNLVWPALSVDQAHYQRYLDFFSLKDARETNRLHPLYCYVLGQNAQLRLLAHREFPFPAAGLVHLSNEVELLRPFVMAQHYQLNLQARVLQLTPAGYELELRTEFHQDNEMVAVNRTLALARAPLKRKRHADQATPIPSPAAENCATPETELPAPEATSDDSEPTPIRRPQSHTPPNPILQPEVSLVMPAWAGTRYARVSGDYNPIHLKPWLARRFGFRHPIAHGMYSLMRVVSVVERQEGMQAQRVQVRFYRPVFLPSISSLAHAYVGTRCHFELTDARGHLQLSGSLS